MEIYIKEVAAKYGMKLNDVFQAAGYTSQPSFSRAINSPETLSMKTLIRIASAIGCEVNEFFSKPTEEPNALMIRCPHCGKVISLSIDD